MKLGLTSLVKSGLRFFANLSDSNYVAIAPPATEPASSITITLPSALPGSEQAVTLDASGNVGYQSLGGGGTVTSVGLSAPASVFNIGGSPVTSSGTLALTLDTQSANTFFAGPSSGGATTPAFRALAFADLSALVGTGASNVAAGNDSRFHTQNTDTGTTGSTFAIDSDATGVLLKNNSGELQIRNLGDSSFSDIRVGNLYVEGTTVTVDSETIQVADNIIELNTNVTGTPTEDSGIQVERGTSTNAQLLWNETDDEWTAGLAGSLKRLALSYSANFTSASLTANVLTVSHNLGFQYPSVTIIDNNNRKIIPDEITFSTANSLSVDLTSFATIPGTWHVSVVG